VTIYFYPKESKLQPKKNVENQRKLHTKWGKMHLTVKFTSKITTIAIKIKNQWETTIEMQYIQFNRENNFKNSHAFILLTN